MLGQEIICFIHLLSKELNLCFILRNVKECEENSNFKIALQLTYCKVN